MVGNHGSRPKKRRVGILERRNGSLKRSLTIPPGINNEDARGKLKILPFMLP
jgi:hypothetical protein